MDDKIDTDFRPKTYFGPERLEKYLLSKVKGAVLREELKELYDAGLHDEVRTLAGDDALTEEDRKALERVHPMFMGGNYLPDTDDGEVEIARISLESTTFDVTCVYARFDDGFIHYRVIDEYEGETLQGPSEAKTKSPMTLGEFADFFLTAWPLMDVLDMNFEGDVDGALGFFSVDSEFYPDLDLLCRQRVREHFPIPDAGDKCPFCGHHNSPPADEICNHAVAWVWDHQLETLAGGTSFGSDFQDLANLVASAEDDSPVRAMLEAQARRTPSRRLLIDSSELPLEQALKSLANAKPGEGWSTNGMLGGSGYTLYVRDVFGLARLASECRAIVEACALNIQTATNNGPDLEALRPDAATSWEFVASGYWYEDVYHCGHIAYYIANPKSGVWVMEARERNAILDDVTEEDVEEGRLNDDQIQAMWGQTLEEAQNAEYRHIVAWTEGIDVDCTSADMATVLYTAVCEAGGNQINESDDRDGLLEV